MHGFRNDLLFYLYSPLCSILIWWRNVKLLASGCLSFAFCNLDEILGFSKNITSHLSMKFIPRKIIFFLLNCTDLVRIVETDTNRLCAWSKMSNQETMKRKEFFFVQSFIVNFFFHFVLWLWDAFRLWEILSSSNTCVVEKQIKIVSLVIWSNSRNRNSPD